MSWRVARPDASVIGSRKPSSAELPAINPQEHGIEAFNRVSSLVRWGTELSTVNVGRRSIEHFPLQCSCGKIDVLRAVLGAGECSACGQRVAMDVLFSVVVVERLVGFAEAYRILVGYYGQLQDAADRRRWLEYEACSREVVGGVH